MANRFDLFEAGKLDARGQEIPDPNPVAIPAGFKRPEPLVEMIRRLTRTTLSDQAQAEGLDTFEEAEDFDVDDEMFDPSSPYEEVFDPILGRGITLDEFRKNEAVYRQRYLEAEARAYAELDRSSALRGIPRQVQSDVSGLSSSEPGEQSGGEATPEVMRPKTRK